MMIYNKSNETYNSILGQTSKLNYETRLRVSYQSFYDWYLQVVSIDFVDTLGVSTLSIRA